MMAVERLVNNSRILTGGLGVVPFSGSLLSKAIAILVKYSGSLWVAEPDDTFVNSDGTGVTSDGSDAGYVRDLCASYGAELISNGDFSQGSTGWSGTDVSPYIVLSLVAGKLLVTSQGVGGAYQLIPTTVGKSYQITGFVRDGTAPDARIRAAANVFNGTLLAETTAMTGGVSGAVSTIFTATTATTAIYLRNGGAGDASFDNISVREIIGRPLFQATTGFKPKLRRVPKKLGPALTMYTGYDGGSTGRYTPNGLNGGTIASGSVYTTARHQLVLNELRSGASYQVSLQVDAISTAGGTPNVNLCDVSPYTFGAIGYVSVVQSRATYDNTYRFVDVEVPANSSLTYSGLTIREVLEWGWAWVFDGTDDVLATVSLPTGTDETIMVCATSLTSAGTARAPMGKRNLNNGLFIRREAGGSLNGTTMTGSGFGSMTLESPHTNFQSFVATVAAKSGATRGRLNGTQKATTAAVYAGWEGQLGVGSEKGAGAGTVWSGYVFAAAYIPGSPPDAELLIVERAMAQLGGVDI